MTTRPVVGISCYVEPVDRGDWRGQRSAVLPWMYVSQVQDAGATAIILPPGPAAPDLIRRLDALIIAGGADIDPARYGEPPHALAQQPRGDRDDWELALADAARARDLPQLAICRGMQILAVAAGGRIEQHLPDRTGTDVHSPAAGEFGNHPVTAVAGTRTAGILGTEAIAVPTYHHQAVEPAVLGPYVPSAWHADGTLEAMEDPAARFIVAVQWHPEAGTDPRLFQALVAAAGFDGDRSVGHVAGRATEQPRPSRVPGRFGWSSASA